MHISTVRIANSSIKVNHIFLITLSITFISTNSLHTQISNPTHFSSNYFTYSSSVMHSSKIAMIVSFLALAASSVTAYANPSYYDGDIYERDLYDDGLYERDFYDDGLYERDFEPVLTVRDLVTRDPTYLDAPASLITRGNLPSKVSGSYAKVPKSALGLAGVIGGHEVGYRRV